MAHVDASVHNFNLGSATNLFKIKYGKLSDNVYNSANVLLGRMKKNYNFTGRQMEFPIPTTFSGGVGSRILPQPNFSDEKMAQITAKKVYSVITVDRESIKAAQNDEGSFVRLTKHAVEKGVESYMRNASRMLFGSGDGVLGTGDGATAITGTGTHADPYVITISAASFKEANWEEQDYVWTDAVGSTSVYYEVLSVAPATRKISLVAIGGAAAPANTDIIYMQGMNASFVGYEPQGLKGVLDATSGSLYGIPVARRWQASQTAAGGAGLTTDRMNQVMLEVARKSGKVPNMILTSYTQFRKLLNLLEDQKQYNLDPRSADLKGKVSFKGVEFMSSAGAVGVFPERFCDDDRMYFLNDNFIECHHRPDFGWFDDDGTVFLRKASSDEYEARYGGYFDNYICPSFHGVLTGLAT